MPLIAQRPSQDLINLVGALGGRWHGATAICRCPAHDDREPSLSLRQGDRDILVTCFAGCTRNDVLRALRQVSPTGIHSGPSAPSRTTVPSQLERLWSEGRAVGGTLGERYLEGRYLPPSLPDLRYHPRCPHGPKPITVFRPALLVAVRDDVGLTAIQRIFLDPENARHLAKLMLGRPGAGAWRGAAATSTLAIAEGFESAAAFALLEATPCWSSLGARRLDQLDLPENLATLIIAHDADVEGRRSAARAEAYYQRPGLRIQLAPPPGGVKDWADALRARRERGGGSRP